jgi:hypothetical protein
MEIIQLPALRSSYHRCPCTTLVNCQLNNSAISSQPPLQSSAELPILSRLYWPNCLLYNSSARTTLKTPFFCYSVRVLFRENVFTELLLRNGCLLICLLHSNGCTRSFRGLCLATGLYAITFKHCWTYTGFSLHGNLRNELSV